MPFPLKKYCITIYIINPLHNSEDHPPPPPCCACCPPAAPAAAGAPPCACIGRLGYCYAIVLRCLRVEVRTRMKNARKENFKKRNKKGELN